MFAVILQSKHSQGTRQTAIVPLGNTTRVFNRIGGGRGIAGAWSEVAPTFEFSEQVIGVPSAITLTQNDYRDLQYPITPTTLLQKLVRTTVGNDIEREAEAITQYNIIHNDAMTNPLSLVQYIKAMSKAVPVAPTTQVVHTPVVEDVVEEVVEEVHTPVMEELQSLRDSFMNLSAINLSSLTVEEPVMQATEALVVPPQNQADAVLTVPDYQPYFERTFDGLSEAEIYNYARQTQQNVLLTGDAGTGKTSSARNYASSNNLPFVTIECTQQIDQSITQGRFVPTGNGNSTVWKYSQLATAIQRPAVILINELTRMTPKAASLFLRLLQERELLIEPMNEVIKVHPDVLFVADQNTGIGYTGTSKQDAALVDRFRVKLEFTYDDKIERNFIKSPALLSFANNIREASELNDEFSVPMSSRILQNFQAQAQALNFSFAVNSLLNNYPKSEGEREAIKLRFDAVHAEIAQELGVELEKYSGK